MKKMEYSKLSTGYVVFYIGLGLWLFKATFNNISVISWQSVLMVENYFTYV